MNSGSLYLLLGDKVSGPFASNSIQTMWQSGYVNDLTPCCPEGTEDWITVRQWLDSQSAVSSLRTAPPRPRSPKLAFNESAEVVTTQLTAKKYKLQIILSCLGMVAGAYLFTHFPKPGAFVAVCCCLWWLSVRIWIYWKHG